VTALIYTISEPRWHDEGADCPRPGCAGTLRRLAERQSIHPAHRTSARWGRVRTLSPLDHDDADAALRLYGIVEGSTPGHHPPPYGPVSHSHGTDWRGAGGCDVCSFRANIQARDLRPAGQVADAGGDQ
jgi:hypothetical protein